MVAISEKKNLTEEVHFLVKVKMDRPSARPLLHVIEEVASHYPNRDLLEPTKDYLLRILTPLSTAIRAHSSIDSLKIWVRQTLTEEMIHYGLGYIKEGGPNLARAQEMLETYLLYGIFQNCRNSETSTMTPHDILVGLDGVYVPEWNTLSKKQIGELKELILRFEPDLLSL